MSTTDGTFLGLRPGMPGPGPANPLATEGYRYPGSFSFQDSDMSRKLFRGRTEESSAVLHSILSSDLLVLYAPSGAGKTSLLNAGVLQQLRDRGYWPVSVRFNLPLVDPVIAIREQIRVAGAGDPSVDIVESWPVESAAGSLWDLLSAVEVWKGNDLQELVLVFDQFEELFTLDWSAETRGRFISDLGNVLRGHRPAVQGEPTGEAPARRRPHAKFVLVIREDSLGALEEMSGDVPQILGNRFRLGALNSQQATHAIKEPASLKDSRLSYDRFEYSDEAVEEILRFLRARGGQAGGADNDAIDPSQLQIVCQHVERDIVVDKQLAPDGVIRVEAADLGGQAGLERILSAFYRRTVELFPEWLRPSVRQLCEVGLISQRGRRLSLEQGEIEQDYHLNATLLAYLVDRRLLRVEFRPGLDSFYYELAHDTLVDAVRADREERMTETARALRRSRRRGVAVAGVLLLAWSVGLGVVLWDTLRGEPSVPTISVGESVTGAATSTYQLVAPRESEVVSVSVVPQTPNANLKVEVSDSEGASNKSAESVDGSGARVWIWGGATYQVTVTADGPGMYQLDVNDVPVQPVGVSESETGSALSLYKITLPKGKAASVSVAPQTPETGLELLVWDSAFNHFDTAQSVDGSGARVLMSTAEGDTFKALVSTEGPGQYDVKVEDFVVPAVDVGDSLTGSGPSIYDIDVAMGEVASVSVVPQAPETGLDVRVSSSSDETVDEARASNGSVARVWILGEAPSRVMVNPDGPGEYAVHVEAAKGTSLDLSDTVNVPGNIDEPGSGVVYEFTSGDPNPHVIRVIPDEKFDPVLRVTEPPNREGSHSHTATSDQPEASATEELTTAGTEGRHLIVVRGYGDSVGGFRLEVEPG